MNSFKLQSLFLAFLFFVLSASAEVRLPALVQSNMVLQQNTEVVFWGWAEPGEVIKIKVDWNKVKKKVITDEKGNWSTTLTTGSAGGPHEILIKGKGKKIILENVLFGEVWLCSGQSNMEFTINRLGGWDSDTFIKDKEDFTNNDYSTIRLFTMARNTADLPQDTCSGAWQIATLDAVDDFSAVAFFYGRELTRKLNVPVGLINSSWGGTPAQAWTPSNAIETAENLAFYHFDSDKEYRPQDKPGSLYNGMIHPLLRYKIKGAIWYQGESNRNDAVYYKDLFSEMIWSWRREFNLGIFPFYFVQIAPYQYNEPLAGALLREAQLQTLEVPATGMAVALDIGNFSDIHPKNKQDIGKRLAFQALAQTYGYNSLEYSGPLFTRGRVEEIPFLEEIRGIRLSFDHVDSGLELRTSEETGFIIAGKDQVFHDAMASIEGNSIFVWSEKVVNPYAVRYAFSNTPNATLFNADGLPASSFRTDQFQILTEMVSISQLDGFSEKSISFEIESPDPNLQVRYTINGPDPVLKSRQYIKPIHFSMSGSLKARVFRGNVPSLNVSRVEIVRHKAIASELIQNTQFDSRYSGGGEKCLVNGILGSDNFQDGKWQGYEGNDLDVLIDLKRLRTVSKVSLAFIQDLGSWIFPPEKVHISVSRDGEEFIDFEVIGNNLSANENSPIIQKFETEVGRINIRYVKVVAKNLTSIPSWHPGAGQKAWLFVDEIVVQ
ncbi:MAG: sialate O-acetylesterase [Bacteroidales bacterium]|nr:sialate O-acetylesterase [Bacteroidales bacterium]